MKTRQICIALGIVATLGLSACASSEAASSPNGTPGASSPNGTPDGPTIVAIYEDVNWYPPCATYPIEIGGEEFYPLPMDAPPVDETKYPITIDPVLNSLSEDGAAAMGVLVFGVLPPGPGDDIGTVIVYSDGMARFESESGIVAWLIREDQEYGYVC